MVMESNPQVSCILVNWNGWQDTVKCLDALKECDYPRLNIIVVDNGSTNDSTAKIKAAHPSVTLLQNSRNLGFAGGSNVGIRHALARNDELLWLLNNDTIPATNALSTLVAKARTDDYIGAIASVCYYADRPEMVQAWAGARVNLWIGRVRNSTEPHSDDWFDSLYGASMLVRSAAIREAGMLDEGFFHYWEETEFCLRLRKKGWRLVAAPDSHVIHKVAGSTGRNNRVLDRYFTASGLRILRLHSSAPPLAMFLFLTGRFVRRIFRLQLSGCKSIWVGMQDYHRSLPIVPKIR
jgi:GT2 family glycosyltransferase